MPGSDWVKDFCFLLSNSGPCMVTDFGLFLMTLDTIWRVDDGGPSGKRARRVRKGQEASLGARALPGAADQTAGRREGRNAPEAARDGRSSRAC